MFLPLGRAVSAVSDTQCFARPYCEQETSDRYGSMVHVPYCCKHAVYDLSFVPEHSLPRFSTASKGLVNRQAL
jgi:hypothetical protein